MKNIIKGLEIEYWNEELNKDRGFNIQAICSLYMYEKLDNIRFEDYVQKLLSKNYDVFEIIINTCIAKKMM